MLKNLAKLRFFVGKMQQSWTDRCLISHTHIVSYRFYIQPKIILASSQKRR